MYSLMPFKGNKRSPQKRLYGFHYSNYSKILIQVFFTCHVINYFGHFLSFLTKETFEYI